MAIYILVLGGGSHYTVYSCLFYNGIIFISSSLSSSSLSLHLLLLLLQLRNIFRHHVHLVLIVGFSGCKDLLDFGAFFMQSFVFCYQTGIFVRFCCYTFFQGIHKSCKSCSFAVSHLKLLRAAYRSRKLEQVSQCCATVNLPFQLAAVSDSRNMPAFAVLFPVPFYQKHLRKK